MFFSTNLGRSTCHFLNVLAFWSLLVSTVLPASRSRHYPRITPADMVMIITTAQPTNSKEVIIKDVGGRPAYRLSVYSLSVNNRTISSIRVELNGIGSSATRSDTQYEDDLLNPDRWGHGAGQRVFLPEQLCPANRRDPAWGARRIFTLRRMRIEVIVSDIELNANMNGIMRAKVTIHVRPGSSMRSRPIDIAYRELRSCT